VKSCLLISWLGGSPWAVPDNPPSFLRRESAYNRRCDIFLSSGNDIEVERDRFERLADVINKQLYSTFVDSPPVVQLNVVRWEQSVPHKTGGDPNGEFRRQAERRSFLSCKVLPPFRRPCQLIIRERSGLICLPSMSCFICYPNRAQGTSARNLASSSHRQELLGPKREGGPRRARPQ
jgi:hypothetical protein